MFSHLDSDSRGNASFLANKNSQFYDLLEIFKTGGYCPDTNYVFLGGAHFQLGAHYQLPSGSDLTSAHLRSGNEQETMSTGGITLSKPFPF